MKSKSCQQKNAVQRPRKVLKRQLKRRLLKQASEPIELSSEIAIGVCLCLLRIEDILNASASPQEALKLIGITIDTAKLNFLPDAWGTARFLHETVENEVRQKKLEKDQKRKYGN